jgi:hypothetical protein
MIEDTPFSSVAEERWSEISDFPGYEVSDWGRVLNSSTGRYIKPTVNTRKLYMVGLMKNAIQHKRSLPLLVARAYVRQPSPEYDTAVNLNGDRANNHYTNLVWRPLWFAREFAKQFIDDHETVDVPIEDIETGEIYKNSMHASTTLGVLDKHIRLSMMCNTYVWPTGQIFREAIDR